MIQSKEFTASLRCFCYISSYPDEGVLTPEMPLNLRVAVFIRLRHVWIVGGRVRVTQMYACCDQKCFCLLINMMFLQKYPGLSTHCPLTFHGCEIFSRTLPSPRTFLITNRDFGIQSTLIYPVHWSIFSSFITLLEKAYPTICCIFWERRPVHVIMPNNFAWSKDSNLKF